MTIKKVFSLAAVILSLILITSCQTLHTYTYDGDLEGIKQKLAEGEDINSFDRYGWAPIHWAVYYQYYGVTEYLLKNGAAVNLETTGSYRSLNKGTTPLMIASYYNMPGATSLLLRKGANPKHTDAKGNSAVSYAKEFNHYEILRLLRGGTPAVAPAEQPANQVVILNDGSRIVGKIIYQDRQKIRIKTKYTTMTVKKSKIKKIQYK